MGAQGGVEDGKEGGEWMIETGVKGMRDLEVHDTCLITEGTMLSVAERSLALFCDVDLASCVAWRLGHGAREREIDTQHSIVMHSIIHHVTSLHIATALLPPSAGTHS